MYDYIGIGNRLLMARARKNIKQHEMGKFLGLSQSSYSQLETGKKAITVEQVYKIAEKLEVPVEWILGLNNDSGFSDLELLRIEELKQYLISQRNK